MQAENILLFVDSTTCTDPGLDPGMLRPDEIWQYAVSGTDYHNMLTANGVNHIWNSLPYGGHDNNSIQPHFYNFMKNIFKV